MNTVVRTLTLSTYLCFRIPLSYTSLRGQTNEAKCFKSISNNNLVIVLCSLLYFTAKSVECSNLSYHARPQNRFGNFNDRYTVCYYPTAFSQQQTQGKLSTIFPLLSAFVIIILLISLIKLNFIEIVSKTKSLTHFLRRHLLQEIPFLLQRTRKTERFEHFKTVSH